MESHKLHLLPGYEADLTSTLDGSLKLYPSRWLAFRGTAPVDIAAVLTRLTSSPRYGLYGTITSPFSAVDVADLVQHTDLGDLVGVGDINLAQTETSGGRCTRKCSSRSIRRTSPSSTSIFLISPFPITKRLSTD